MNKALLFFIVFFSATLQAQEMKKVLFLGNSYTAVNNLPLMTATLALSAGDTLVYDSNTPGGYTLNGHTTNALSLQKIAQGDWDFVVLQEQSQLPAFPNSQVQTDCFPYAALLDSLITTANSCTETMFYMTWGRQNGDAANCPTWPPVCTYTGMDSLLRLRYDQMAIDNEGVLSPVGAVWNYLRLNSPGINLYQADESHPSLEGSYAAACSFYASIFRKDPTLINDDYGLPPVVAMDIRNAAKAVVFDSLLTWHIGEYDPVAGYSVVTIYFTASFTNLSSNATSYLWDFGNGNTSSLVNPTVEYLCGTREVTLTASKCGLQDVISDTILFWPPAYVYPCDLQIQELERNRALEISPNPTTDFVQLELKSIDKLTVYDASGRAFKVDYLKNGGGFELDMTSLDAGFYWIRIESDRFTYSAKVLKE